MRYLLSGLGIWLLVLVVSSPAASSGGLWEKPHRGRSALLECGHAQSFF